MRIRLHIRKRQRCRHPWPHQLNVKLIDFPVFNVADCYVTVGAVLLAVLILFVYKEEELGFLSLKRQEGKKKDA